MTAATVRHTACGWRAWRDDADALHCACCCTTYADQASFDHGHAARRCCPPAERGLVQRSGVWELPGE